MSDTRFVNLEFLEFGELSLKAWSSLKNSCFFLGTSNNPRNMIFRSLCSIIHTVWLLLACHFLLYINAVCWCFCSFLMLSNARECQSCFGYVRGGYITSFQTLDLEKAPQNLKDTWRGPNKRWSLHVGTCFIQYNRYRAAYISDAHIGLHI